MSYLCRCSLLVFCYMYVWFEVGTCVQLTFPSIISHFGVISPLSHVPPLNFRFSNLNICMYIQKCTQHYILSPPFDSFNFYYFLLLVREWQNQIHVLVCFLYLTKKVNIKINVQKCYLCMIDCYYYGPFFYLMIDLNQFYEIYYLVFFKTSYSRSML